MWRIVIAMTFAFAMVVGIVGGTPTQSLALQASPTAALAQPEELCTPVERDKWQQNIHVRPFEPLDAFVQPLDSPGHELYLVVWTINRGTCVPYEAEGNQKDGALVLIVQEGVIEFTAQPFAEGSTAQVSWGYAAGKGETVQFGQKLTLESGAWVTQNDQVYFTFRALTDAVILKAVLVKTPDPPDPTGGSRCGGGCK